MTPDLHGDEKNLRRWQRYEIDCRVKLSYVREGKKYVNYGRSQDMSIGGMMLTSAADLRAGERVELEFLPPNMPEVLRLDGVVRQQPGNYSYGLEFRDVTDEQRRLVRRMFEVLNVIESLK